MKHLILISLFIPMMVFGQANQTLKVKLVDYSIDKMPPACGYIAYSTILKFEVIEKFDTLKEGQNILAIINCPDFFGIENYINDQEYDMTLRGPIDDKELAEYSYVIWNKYEKEKLPRLISNGLAKR